MKETGELLKKTRMEKDLSLRQVSEALKISVRVLQAIEEDDPKYLPPRVFLRGFIQSYAAYLQIDVDQILECFQRDEAQSQAALTPTPPPPVPEDEEIIEPKPAPVAPKPEKPKKSKKKKAVWAMDYRKWSFASKAFAFLIVAILVALILFVAQMVEKYEKESIVEHKEEIEVPPISHEQDESFVSTLDDESEVAPEVEGAETEVTADDEAGEADGNETEVVAEAPKAEEPKAADPVEPAKETAEASQPEPPQEEKPAEVVKPVEEKPAAEKPVEKKPEEEKPKVAESPAAAQPPEKPPVSSGSQEVIVEAFDKVQLTYTLDGEKKQSVTLNPGDLHTLKADSKIQVQIDNGGAVNVFHNGKDRGVPGKIGQSLNMTFP